MAKATNKERAQARAMNKDRQSIERLGVNAGARLGFGILSKVLAAFKAGRDPTGLLDSLFRRTETMLLDAMVNAHLVALTRKIKISPTFALTSSAYQESVKVAKKRAGLTAKEVAELSEIYGPQAAAILSATKESVTRSLQKTLTRIQVEGLHVRDGIKELTKTFKRLGITPANSFSLENMFRTNTQIAYSAGRWQADQDPAIQEILWGYRYTTVGDSRTRPTHAGLDGVTLPKDDPRWDRIMPPNGYSCRCSVIPIFEERKIVLPKDSVKVDGVVVTPGPDAGFAFNPGKVFNK